MRNLERVLVGALCLLLGWFYAWTASSNGDSWRFGLEQRDYYNLLIDGWLDGQLHLKVPVPEALLKLKDPYDPALRPPGLGLHDATFYRGKYYLYFGAAPVVTLMLPFRLVTGLDLPLAAAVLIFVYGGFLVSVGILLAVRRRYFPSAGSASVLGGVLVLGLAALGPVLLRRPHMWELPIGAGYCFAMLTLGCLWRSLHVSEEPGAAGLSRSGLVDSRGIPCLRPADRRRRAVWLAWAGTCLGLAIASRPTYLLASPFLAVPLVGWWWTERRVPWRPALAALGPLAIIGAAMAAHNYARFDHPLQFGQAYQLSLDYESKMAHFRLSHVPFNVWRYFFSAAEWSRFFPFIAPAALPPKPPGFGGHDDVYGLLTNLPIAWLALAAPLAVWRRERGERRALGLWLATVAGLFAGMAGTLIFFFGSLARYQSDFAPALMLLALGGWLGLGRWLRVTQAPVWQVAGGVFGGAAALGSAVFGVLFSLQLDGLLRERNPAGYREVARRLNRGPAWVERLGGVRYGPVELTLRLAPAAPDTRELLLAAGAAPRVDRLYLRHHAGGRGSFEVESAFGIREATPPEPLPAGEHRLRVVMGALLPPAEHPWYGAATAAETATLVRELRLDLDGRTLLRVSPWFSAPAGPVQVPPGATAVLALRREEGGVAASREKTAALAREAEARFTQRGALDLQVSLPANRTGAREPLLVLGRPGRGDLLAIEYGEAGAVRFLFDHWGGETLRSEPVAVAAGKPVGLRVTLASLRRPLPEQPVRPVVVGRLEVAVEGRSVWRVPAEFYAVDPVEVAVGRNRIGGTSCGPEFTGVVHRWAPVGP